MYPPRVFPPLHLALGVDLVRTIHREKGRPRGLFLCRYCVKPARQVALGRMANGMKRPPRKTAPEVRRRALELLAAHPNGCTEAMIAVADFIERWLQVRLGCLRLSPACPFRLLHIGSSSKGPNHRGLRDAFFGAVPVDEPFFDIGFMIYLRNWTFRKALQCCRERGPPYGLGHSHQDNQRNAITAAKRRQLTTVLSAP